MIPPAVDRDPLDLTILITCYNEERFILGSITAAHEAARASGLSYEILVIDDCSTDSSVEIILRFLEANPNVPARLHRNVTNRGFANNYVDGAFLGRGKYYHLVCGDDSMPTEYLLAAYRLIGQADMIVPYQNQNEINGKSPFRKYVSKVFTALVSLLSGYRLRYYNGLAVQTRYNVMRWHPVSYGFGFQADIVTMLLDQGVTYAQVYSQSIDKKGGGSMSMRNFLSVTHSLLEIFFRRIRRMLYGKNWPKSREVFPESSPRSEERTSPPPTSLRASAESESSPA